MNFNDSPGFCETIVSPQKVFTLSNKCLAFTYNGKRNQDLFTKQQCLITHFKSFNSLPAGICEKLCYHFTGPLAISVNVSLFVIHCKNRLQIQVIAYFCSLFRSKNPFSYCRHHIHLPNKRSVLVNNVSVGSTPPASVFPKKPLVLILCIFKLKWFSQDFKRDFPISYSKDM